MNDNKVVENDTIDDEKMMFCFRMRTACLHVPHTINSPGIIEWHNEAKD